MEGIGQRLLLYEIATGLGVMLSVFFYFDDVKVHLLYRDTLLISAILISLLLLAFLLREHRKFRTACLIMENKILHIQPAKVDGGDCADLDLGVPIGEEVYISCFGVLIGSKIIKFNLQEIHLKAVQIGRDNICLSYGTGEKTETLRILHKIMSPQELGTIADRFQYETGVIPEVKD